MPVHQFPKLTDPAALEAMRSRQSGRRRDGLRDAVRPAGFLRHPDIRHHPVPPQPAAAASRRLFDELGDHMGRTETGFSIFRPTDGLDEGPVILMRSVPIEPEDTLGSLYFGKIFPMGVAGAGRGGASRSSPARRRRSRRTNRAPATRASFARRNRASTGPTTSISPTT